MYCWSDGRKYVGDWKNDVMQGRGKLSHPDGSTYEGEFHHGVFHGQGRFTWANGTYEGTFVNGKREKHGKYSWFDGRVYEGEWQDDKRNGKGTYIHQDGSKYEGESSSCSGGHLMPCLQLLTVEDKNKDPLSTTSKKGPEGVCGPTDGYTKASGRTTRNTDTASRRIQREANVRVSIQPTTTSL